MPEQIALWMMLLLLLTGCTAKQRQDFYDGMMTPPDAKHVIYRPDGGVCTTYVRGNQARTYCTN